MALRGGGGALSGREVKRWKFCLSVRGAGCCEVVQVPALEVAKTCLWMILRGPTKSGISLMGVPFPRATAPHHTDR